jgi:hypothetical protein
MIHIGKDVVLYDEEMVAVLDIQKDPGMQLCRGQEEILLSDPRSIRSAVVALKDGRTLIYYSPLKAQVIGKRTISEVFDAEY